ncbi:MAG: hypothetical protein ACE5E0_02855 [Terriglobia bacterium]
MHSDQSSGAMGIIGLWQDVKTFGGGGFAQPLVQGDEVLPGWTLKGESLNGFSLLCRL